MGGDIMLSDYRLQDIEKRIDGMRDTEHARKIVELLRKKDSDGSYKKIHNAKFPFGK